MSLSRRSLVKLGLQASALPLLEFTPFNMAAAEERAPAAGANPRVRARAIPLKAVRLTGGPLKRAQDADIKYLLSLEPDRMLAYYRRRAGLAQKAEPYDGWDGDGRNLTGHIAGHYLSAISLMYAATGDARFRDRARYMTQDLDVVQQKNGDGYLCALENGRRCFGELAEGHIRSAAFDLNGEWSPWYTVHKLFAGLRDAHRHVGDATALRVETRYAAWVEKTLSGLTDAQIQDMLGTEFGGMNEVLVDLAADTGDARWLRLSYSFEHRAFIEPLQRYQDDLGGKHGNTQIPKLIGSAQRFIDVGNPADYNAANYFWDAVARHHSFSTGGDGTDEYFGPRDELGARVDGRTAESCNVYNMLKLSRMMFSMWPDVHYADFHERALFNHAMASFDTDDGRMCYMVPVGRGVVHEYQDMQHSFTCCVGTGMENHALAGDGLYFENGKQLWVNQYASSTADWREAGVRLRMESDFPEGETARLTLALEAPRAFTLSVRRPYWVGDGFAITVNGSAVAVPAVAKAPAPVAGRRVRPDAYAWPVPVSTYVDITRTWHSGDVVQVTLPKTLRLEPTPDNARRVAIMWGPLVLAGDLAPEPPRQPGEETELTDAERPAVPIFVAADQPVDTWVVPVAGSAGHFRTKNVGRDPDAAGTAHDVDLVPFHNVHHRIYAIYWDLVTPTEWTTEQAGFVKEAERLRKLDAASVGYVLPGDAAAEKTYDYQGGADVQATRIEGRMARAGRSWFSYDLPVDPSHPMALLATYFTADRRTTPASFEILVDGAHLADQQIERSDPARFYDVTYALPPEMVRGKSKVTVKFMAKPRSQIAAVFGVRMIRADQPL